MSMRRVRFVTDTRDRRAVVRTDPAGPGRAFEAVRAGVWVRADFLPGECVPDAEVTVGPAEADVVRRSAGFQVVQG